MASYFDKICQVATQLDVRQLEIYRVHQDVAAGSKSAIYDCLVLFELSGDECDPFRRGCDQSRRA